MDNHNLQGLKVLVTRPLPQGEGLCSAIRNAGGEALSYPTVLFAPPSDVTLCHQAIKTLDQQDWLIIISPQAVYASCAWIQATWPLFPPTLKCAAIGEGSALAWLKAGFPRAIYPDQAWDSEGLVSLPAFANIENQRIALLLGEGGRKVLKEQLSAKGAIVTEIFVYRRVAPSASLQLSTWLKEDKIEAIVCTSADGIKNLKEGLLWQEKKKLQTISLIVISQRLQEIAKDEGFQCIWRAENPSTNAIMAILSKLILERGT